MLYFSGNRWQLIMLELLEIVDKFPSGVVPKEPPFGLMARMRMENFTMKNVKSTGPGGNNNEILKYGGTSFKDRLVQV